MIKNGCPFLLIIVSGLLPRLATTSNMNKAIIFVLLCFISMTWRVGKSHSLVWIHIVDLRHNIKESLIRSASPDGHRSELIPVTITPEMAKGYLCFGTGTGTGD
jgi:hypothetical protein